MALLDQLQQIPVGQDPTSQGIAALPQANVAGSDASTYVPPTDNSAAPDPTQTDPTQSAQPDIGAAVSTAAQSPELSQGLLQAFGDKFSDLSSKLKSLSPAASQGLLAAGLGILANNDGYHNLNQLVGIGGISGMNAYSDAKQQAVQQQALQQQRAVQLAAQQETARQNAFNNQMALMKFNQDNTQTVSDNAAVYNKATGQFSMPPTSNLVAGYQQVTNPDGSVSSIPVNKAGQQVQGALVGTPKDPNVGPLPSDRLAIVNGAATDAIAANTALKQTQNLLTKLSPTIADPNDPSGKTQIPNPDYVDVGSGGVATTAYNYLNNLVGGQSQAAQYRAQVSQEVRTANMQAFKGLGRFTNMDMQILQQGMPSNNSDAQSMQNYLQSFGKLQEAQAMVANSKAAYLAANRGDSSPLSKPTVINGVTYPAGWTLQQIASGQQPTQNNSVSGMVGQYSNSDIDAAIARKMGR